MYKYTIKKGIWHKVGKIKRNPYKMCLYTYVRDLVNEHTIKPEYNAGPALWKVLDTGPFEYYSGLTPSKLGAIFIGGYAFKMTMFDCEEI